MGSFSIWHWLIVLLWGVVVVVTISSMVKILRRMGFSGWLAVIAFLPFGNVIGLWLLSRARWPAVDKH